MIRFHEKWPHHFSPRAVCSCRIAILTGTVVEYAEILLEPPVRAVLLAQYPQLILLVRFEGGTARLGQVPVLSGGAASSHVSLLELCAFVLVRDT